MGVGAIAASFIIQFIVGAAAGYVLGKLAIRMLNKAQHRQSGVVSYLVAGVCFLHLLYH